MQQRPARQFMLPFGDPSDLTVFDFDGPVAIEAVFDERTTPVVQEAILDWLAQIPLIPGIAGFKLQSNDWWIVTTEECQSALEALGDQVVPDLGDWGGWDRWIQFLQCAAGHGGFQVT